MCVGRIVVWGSPAGPGLSMVVPVNWMVSRKIWINWSCETGVAGMHWVSAACLVVVGTGWKSPEHPVQVSLHRVVWTDALEMSS